MSHREAKDIRKATIEWCTAGAFLAITCMAGPALLSEDSARDQIPPGFDYADSSPEPTVTEQRESATTKFSTLIACPGVLGTNTSFTEDVTVTISSRDVTSELAVTELYVGSPDVRRDKCQARMVLSGPAVPDDLQADGSVQTDADPWTPRRITVPLGEDTDLVWKRTDPDEWIVKADRAR
ncbi:hypothetical protein [Streptomyces sp. Tue6028]|uniref:hypothetical protein n=1 Tax=Streptomyces sp. Tue6028 TaxID=2036037 RepID=UPI003D7476A7